MGGNIGDTTAGIERAVERLQTLVGRALRRSSMMVSEAWGFSAATPPFTNQAVEFETSLSPEELIEATQKVERECGRDRERECEEKSERGEKYASRVIDIDIIFYGELTHLSDRLTIPHPLMQSREFVLRPIVEIAPEWRNVTLGKSCEELLNELINR